MTKSPLLLFLYLLLIFLAIYLPLCFADRHTPKRHDRRSHDRHAKDTIDAHVADEPHQNSKPKTTPRRHNNAHAPEATNPPKQQHIDERKQLSIESCEVHGHIYFDHCAEMSAKTGHCQANELPMRAMDCLHLKKFINTNLHTLVEAPINAGANPNHTVHPHPSTHADGDHVGAFVTVKNVMCCHVDRENALRHAIQLINNRLMLAHELALYRFAHNIPVDDPEHEAIALKSVGNQANAAGIDAEFAVNFLLAQMEANKIIQRGYINRWNSDHSFESKYVPDLEKEIHPKMTYITNAVILALIPLVVGGHQLYDEPNCVGHVQAMLNSMDHLRASELEPNGRVAMEKAVRGLCDKVIIHHYQQEGQINNEAHAKNEKIKGGRTSNKVSKDEESKSVEKRTNRRRGGQDDNLGKKSPKKIEKVSDQSIMIRPGDQSRELIREMLMDDKLSTSHENAKARKEKVVATKVKSPKSPKKSPRRYVVSDRSVLIRMEEDEPTEDNPTTTATSNESHDIGTDKRHKNGTNEMRTNKSGGQKIESDEFETEAYSKNLTKKSPFKKQSTDGTKHDGEGIDDVFRKESIFDNSRTRSSITDKSRNDSIGMDSLRRNAADTSTYQQRKDSLMVYRQRQRRLSSTTTTNKSVAASVELPNQIVDGKSERQNPEKSILEEEEHLVPKNNRRQISNAKNVFGDQASLHENEGRRKVLKENDPEEDSDGANITVKVDPKINGEKEGSAEFHHIELEPDAESIVIHTGGKKPVKIKLNKKSAKGNNENTKKEEGSRKNSHARDAVSAQKSNEQSNKNHANIGEEQLAMEEEEEEDSDNTMQRNSAKKSVKVKRVMSEEGNDDGVHKQKSGEANNDGKENADKLKNSPKQKFKIKKVGSEEEMNENNEVLGGRQRRKKPSENVPANDKSNEYVVAPEKISAEFGDDGTK